SGWYWRYIFGRIEFSLWPGSWLFSSFANNAINVSNSGSDINIGMAKFDFINAIVSLDNMLSVLVSPELWIGAVAGVAMIAAAIHFRQSRTEAYS
ncbi:MAG: hypothetical protein ABI846_00340, partial [Rudaea sp.]